tara:strand:+ start:136 stop:774 length:639 start_codon:yes stop_codon:yes gene_type:complete
MSLQQTLTWQNFLNSKKGGNYFNKPPYKIEDLKFKNNVFKPDIDSTEVVPLNAFEQILGGFRLGGKGYKNIFQGRGPWSGIEELSEDIKNRSVKENHDYRGGTFNLDVPEEYRKGNKIEVNVDNKDEKDWEKIMGIQKDMLKELNKDQLQAAFMMKGIDIASNLGAGQMRAADSYDNLTRSIAAIAGALPEYKAPGFTISPMAYQDYAFGRG